MSEQVRRKLKAAMQENARLQAEVERLILASQGFVKYVDHTMALARQATKHHKEIESLEAQVERLTKAGDKMADECSNFQGAWPLIKDWNAAKGVQS